MVNFTRAVSALALAATATAAPANTTAKATESGLTWTVKDFDFHADYVFTTPAHQNSYGYVKFTLTSDKTGLVYGCSAQSSQIPDFFYEFNDAYPCTAPQGAAEGIKASWASFKYNRPDGKLILEETIVPAEGETYTASGSTTIKTTCTDESKGPNPNWQIGENYSERHIVCEKTDATVAGTVA
ncbi:hypothetical protein B0H65DRAFT_208578 [Neurospora tetraspora]|uniref:AA1-like domain-containing protein n=1 Tax=Neurospora tetraspora TaxID=94610 RepID=A0AAE0MTE3_9PEZI|nr:hypothetical protein B0H65DRAFT_208578 [Neurospora tetraspora]